MGKCLNIGKNIGKSNYRSLAVTEMTNYKRGKLGHELTDVKRKGLDM